MRSGTADAASSLIPARVTTKPVATGNRRGRVGHVGGAVRQGELRLVTLFAIPSASGRADERQRKSLCSGRTRAGWPILAAGAFQLVGELLHKQPHVGDAVSY